MLTSQLISWLFHSTQYFDSRFVKTYKRIASICSYGPSWPKYSSPGRCTGVHWTEWGSGVSQMNYEHIKWMINEVQRCSWLLCTVGMAHIKTLEGCSKCGRKAWCPEFAANDKSNLSLLTTSTNIGAWFDRSGYRFDAFLFTQVSYELSVRSWQLLSQHFEYLCVLRAAILVKGIHRRFWSCLVSIQTLLKHMARAVSHSFNTTPTLAYGIPQITPFLSSTWFSLLFCPWNGCFLHQFVRRSTHSGKYEAHCLTMPLFVQSVCFLVSPFFNFFSVNISLPSSWADLENGKTAHLSSHEQQKAHPPVNHPTIDPSDLNCSSNL